MKRKQVQIFTKQINICLMLILAFNNLFSQTNQSLRPLSIGDKMPDYIFKNLINYPSKTAEISDFKGKVLIIDFWSTYCGACIAAWPKMIALQNKFKDKVQFMLVNTSQGEDIVRPIIEKRERILNYKMTLPSVCGDSALRLLFPHTAIPHVIWIGTDGKVANITDGSAINETNIDDMLANKLKPIVQKKDIKENWNVRLPLFKDGNGGSNENVLYQSIFSKGKGGLPSTCYVITDSLVGYQVAGINVPIKTLFQFAYFNQLYKDNNRVTRRIPLSRTILNVKDTTNYVPKIGDKYQKENYYIYQYYSTYPVTKNYLLSRIRTDICRQFNLEGYIEKMEKECLVLSVKDSSLLPIQNQEPFALMISDLKVKINSAMTSQIIAELEESNAYYSTGYPFIDETNYSHKLYNIEFEANIKDYNTLNKQLHRYGLELTVKKRKIDVLVIEKSQNSDPLF